MLLALLLGLAGGTFAQGDAKRGQYMAKAAGCVGCHTEAKPDAAPYAGGRGLKTPFGTFYGPNITPHSQAGIGRWSEADFIRALRRGERPDGAHYYPSFPYPSFTKMSDQDMKDLWAYLRTLPPSSRPNEAHALRFPFQWRVLVAPWKWLFFTPGAYVNDPRLTPVQSRGAYLVQAPGHCSECHTPRNFLGAPAKDRFLAGAKDLAPNITPTRLKKWSDSELKEFLTTGVTPEFDAAAEAMDEVIRNTTSQLTPGDLDALVAYLRSVPAKPEAKQTGRK
ncbi:MAG: hypothetical protein A3G27_15535 [Betaproteobacteria bacterium RIFCSPLOWO2_12_FULL_66_14]|nr:MAG: hypothetical protein A3G27_15535 [Betaproteobacteria bacterium RIFCSPLOWO2_12_FULL_66_14]